jgi:hypothetical protein
MMAQSFQEFARIYVPLGWKGNWTAQVHRAIDIATPWIVFALLGSGWLRPQSEESGLPARATQTGAWLAPLAFAGLIFACFAPAAYAMSTNMPGRAFIVPVFAATLGMAVWGYFCGQALRNRLRAFQRQAGWQPWAAAAILLLLGLNSLWSARLAFKTQPVYSAYAQAWSENERLIAELRNEVSGPIILPPVINPVFGFSELTSDPSGFINQCMSGYYGIELRTTAPPIP